MKKLILIPMLMLASCSNSVDNVVDNSVYNEFTSEFTSEFTGEVIECRSFIHLDTISTYIDIGKEWFCGKAMVQKVITYTGYVKDVSFMNYTLTSDTITIYGQYYSESFTICEDGKWLKRNN